MKRSQFLGAAAAAGTLLALPSRKATAQRYPDKLVRIVVSYTVGGNLDLTARLFGQALAEELGQPFVIENRPGANGNTATRQLARSTPDGYTLAMVAAATMTINPSLYQNMGFDPEKDLAPISIVATGPLVLEVNNAMPFRTVQELVAYAKANPGKLNFGSGGNGTLAHLSIEMLKVRTGIDVFHVPYKGTSLAVTDVMAGHLQAIFDTLSTAVPLIREGKMRAIAVTSAKRSAVFPDVPTISEAGVKDYVAETWAGLVAPAGTPPEVIARIHAAVAKIAAREQIQGRLAAVGSEAVGNSPEEFATVIRNDRARWGEIIKLSGARAE